MARRARAASPTLGAAGTMIGTASRALLSDANEFAHSFELDMDDVGPDPDQPRRHFDEDAIAALAQTLKTEGQLQPILVRRDPGRAPGWIIVAGERRWRAARLNGWVRLLAIPYEGDPYVATLLENLQRVDLTPVEEATGIQKLLAQKGWTQDRAAQVLGKSKADLSGTLRILQLPPDILEAVLTSESPPAKNVLIELARVDRAALPRLASLARSGALTVKAVRQARLSAEEPPAAPRTVRRRGTSAWSAIGRALDLLDRLDQIDVTFNDEQSMELRRLRDAIDAILARGD